MSDSIQQLFSVGQQQLLAIPNPGLYALRMNLGKRLKKAREARGLDQDALCALVPRSSQQQISNLEVRDSLTTELIFEFAAALRVNPRWLQNGTEPSGLETEIGWIAPETLTPIQLQIIALLKEMPEEAQNGVLALVKPLHALVKNNVPPTVHNMDKFRRGKRR
jgi:transcriptional regulator with XRE-family HTH domain